MRNRTFVSVFALCCFCACQTIAQSTFTGFEKNNLWNAGLPFITTYTPTEYKGDSQNWGFLQSDNDIIYVANSAGVLEFDGINWRLIKTTNSGTVRSLAQDDRGTIYVGGSREVGYLEPDENGLLQYRSLMPELPTKFHNFTDVWNTYFLNDAIYFVCPQYIFKWKSEQFEILLPSKSFVGDIVFNGELMVIDDNIGLKILKEDSLHLAPYGDKISSNLKMLPFDSESILVIDNTKGSFLYDFKSYKPFSNKKELLFKGNNGYHGIRMANGNFVLATTGEGVYVFGGNGDIKSHFTVKKGLISDVVYNVFQDNHGDVWIGTASGINRLEISVPLRKFSKSSGIDEGVIATAFHQNKVYASSFNSLLSLDMVSVENSDLDREFTKSRALDSIREAFSMASAGQDLWVGATGIFLLRNGEVVKVLRPEDKITHGYKIIKSRFDNEKMYAVNIQGQLFEVYKKEETWHLSEPLAEIEARIHHLIEDKKGLIWLATYANGVHRVEGLSKKNPTSNIGGIRVVKYDTLKGLPSLRQNAVSESNGIVFSGGSNGLYRFHEASDTFKKDTLLDRFFSEKKYECGLLASGVDESLWIPASSGFGLRLFKLDKNEEINEVVSVRRNDDNTIFNINATQKGTALIAGPKGLLLYREDIDTTSMRLPKLNIRSVTVNTDSTLFGGFRNAVSKRKELTYESSDFRFLFALANYGNTSKTQYQHQLVGYDEEWSNWSSESQKDYTNLTDGQYTFRVRGKNSYGLISKEDTYTFSIRSPWFRTWWAYLCYLALAGLLVWLFYRWRSMKLRRENMQLEAVIAERTTEIRKKNKLLSYQTERLKELDTMKTRLFANISHEFRTPLTLIKGPIENLEGSGSNQISTPNIKMIRRNANRLLNLVNQLLDLSKLDSGKLELDEAEGDVFKCVRAAASSFSSHAASRHMDYQIKIPSHLLWAKFDRDKLEKVIYNLLSNAFKFTKDEDRVIVEATFRSQRLNLKVSDSGAGISKEKLPHIFDRFFQVDDSYTKEKTGSGIGLALTKELVELMRGTIYVESEMGKGTLFRVVIPLEEIHTAPLKENEAHATLLNVDDESTEVIQSHVSKAANVLIIEDNNDMRHFIREQLEQNYQILEARNGKEGLEMANKIVPNLIISDLMMPHLDGITLCKKLKTNLTTSHVPIIMLTAKAGIENKLEGLETGADDYLTKPFNGRELQIRAKNLIDQRQQLRELFSKNISLDPKEITVSSLDEKFLKEVVELLEQKYSDSEFGVPQMQTGLGMGKTLLHTKIKALTNHPPGEPLFSV